MATRVKPVNKEIYEEDFYAWSKAQADLLRAGRFADLDLEHLIEEIDDLGESLKRSVRSRIRTIIEHLLKLEHSPTREPCGGWYDTILAQRSDLLDELTASIRREIEPTLPDLYDRARQNAATSLRQRARGRRRPARLLPIHPRPDHRRLAAVRASVADGRAMAVAHPDRRRCLEPACRSRRSRVD